MKKGEILSYLFVSVAFVIVVLFYLYYDSNFSNKKAITDEAKLEMELRIGFYPKGNAVSEYFAEFDKDGKITRAEYTALKRIEEEYLEAVKSGTLKLQTDIPTQEQYDAMSELEQARENLKSFDRFGVGFLTEQESKEARQQLVNKIIELERKQ